MPTTTENQIKVQLDIFTKCNKALPSPSVWMKNDSTIGPKQKYLSTSR